MKYEIVEPWYRSTYSDHSYASSHVALPSRQEEHSEIIFLNPLSEGSPAAANDDDAAFPGLFSQPAAALPTAVGTASSDAAVASVGACGPRDPWNQLEVAIIGEQRTSLIFFKWKL